MQLLCNHDWKKIDQITKLDFQQGDKRFPGFYTYPAGLDVLAARKNRCTLCGEERTSVEVLHSELRKFIPIATLEQQAKNFLLDSAKGKLPICYSAFYEKLGKPIGQQPWSPLIRFQATRLVENLVIDIAEANLANGEPPLNALLVNKKTQLPGDGWLNWARGNNYLKSAKQAQNEAFAFAYNYK